MAVSITYAANAVTTQFGISGPDVFAEDVLGLSTGGFVASGSSVDAGGDFHFAPQLTFYDASMNVVATRFPAAGATDGLDTHLTQLTNTNVVVVWDENDAGNPGVKAAIYDSVGNLVRAEFAVSTVSTAHDYVSVTALYNGNFVVESGNAGGSGVTFRTYDSAGNPVGLADNSVDAAAGDSRSEITVMGNGGFVASWYNSGTHAVRGRIYDSNGTAQAVAFDLGANASEGASLAAYGLGFVAAYRDTQWSGEGITLKIFDSSGTNTTPGGIIRVDQSDGIAEGTPDVVVMQDGNLMVSWTRGPDVYARIFDASGLPLTPQFMVSNAGSTDGGPAASLLTNGEVAISWTRIDDPVNDPYGNVEVAKVLQLVRTVTGDAAADTYASPAFDHTRDSVSGGNRADSLSTGNGADTISGDGGNDFLEGGDDSDLISGGLGRDRIYGASKASPNGLYPAPDTVDGGAGDDLIYGASGGDSISGGADEDKALGLGGDDRISGDLGEDTLVGGDGDDLLQGGLDGDSLAGGAGNDAIYGMTQAAPDGSTVGDAASGGAGADLVRGSAGDDDLSGDGGRDTLTGGAGTDTLEGGLLADRFVYLAASDSTYFEGPDRITDLTDIDRIDLSAIDANPFEAGDQKFKLVSDLTGHPGEVRVTFLTAGPYAGSTGIIGDVDGDGTPDFFIVADGNHAGYDNFIY